MANGWLIFIGLVVAYMGFLFWLISTERMQKWNLSLMLGFILMIRTQRGKGLLQIISKPKRFWNAFGDFGTVLTLAGMAAMTILMAALVYPSLQPDSGIEPLGASEILVIPGVNPFVPLWYGIIALIVTLVVHEGGHGVLALTNKMRVKSLGLLVAIVPIGAFVEPDEDDLNVSPRRHRLRVFAAGATINLVFAAAILATFALLVGMMTPAMGVPISTLTEGDPGEQAGIEPGDLIVAANGAPLADPAAFSTYMDSRSPGDTIVFTTAAGTDHTATLTSRWQALGEDGQRQILEDWNDQRRAQCSAEVGREVADRNDCVAGLQQSAFLGIRIFDAGLVQDVLGDPVGSLPGFLFTISLPIGEVRGSPYLSTYLPAFFETPFSEDLFWPLVNTAYWVFWINLMVGLTNILPMLPLDGGHIFRDGFGGLVAKLRPNMDPERRDKMVGKAAGIISFAILGMFLLQIFGPRIAQSFA